MNPVLQMMIDKSESLAEEPRMIIENDVNKYHATMCAYYTAKDNVRYLLDHPMALVDMHGIVYWAERVEQLRAELQEAL